MAANLKQWAARYGLAAIILAAGLAFIFATATVERVTGYARLNSAAKSSIDDALQKNTYAFLGVSALKTGMAMIEGSSVGVGFDVEVGDLVQATYDYVDYVWKIMLYSLTLLGLYKLLLETGFLALGLKLAGVGLIALAIGPVVKKRARLVKAVGARCLMLGLLVAYLVPVALLGTDYIASTYTKPLKDKNAERIDDVRREFEQSKREFVLLKENLSITNPGESINQLKVGLLRITGSVTNLLSDSTSVFVEYTAILLFELLILPFLSAFVIFKFTHVAFAKLLESTKPAPAPMQEQGAAPA